MTDNLENKVGMLAKYLNDCWASLVGDSDPFVVSNIRAIIECIPDEAPLCLFHMLFAIGKGRHGHCYSLSSYCMTCCLYQ